MTSVAALEKALETILQNNFDADSKVCLQTILQLIDNIYKNKRQINLSNPNFHSRVGQRQGGIEFLVACGFIRNNDNTIRIETETISHWQAARRLVVKTLVEQLKVNPNDIPKPKTVKLQSKQQVPFDPYKGLITSDSNNNNNNNNNNSNYVSTTQQALTQLEQQRQALERQRPSIVERDWVALRPHEQPVVVNDTSSTASTSDAALFQAKLQQQQAAAKEREHFTTKAMRDVQRLKNQKVYASCRLQIALPDGSKLLGTFGPTETVQTVQHAVATCFTTSTSQFDLYVTPPRRTLPLTATLETEGLVPAAKLFVSFVGGSAAATIRPDLYQTNTNNSAFPTGQAIHKEDASKKKSTTKPIKKKTKVNKEQDLLRRMMGK